MYAIIEAGGKQYKVEKGDVIDIERQSQGQSQDKEAQGAGELVLDRVLLIAGANNIQIGRPYVKGAKVKAQVINNLKGPKVISYKYRRRKSSHWKKGHRQLLTRIKIKEIELG